MSSSNKNFDDITGVAAVDIDGTLMGKSLEITRETHDGLKALHDLGMLVVIATGRMAVSARRIAHEAGLSGPIICYNGAWIENSSGEQIYHSSLEKNVAAAIIKLPLEAPLMAFCDDRLYYTRKDDRVERYEDRVGVKGQLMSDMNLLPSIPTKFIVTAPLEKLNDYEKIIRNSLKSSGYAGEITLVKSSADHLEIISSRDSKGKGLALLLEHLGLNSPFTAAIGDADNDIPMFEMTDLSFCMGNGSEKAKKSANYIVPSVNDDGFLEACLKIVQEREGITAVEKILESGLIRLQGVCERLVELSHAQSEAIESSDLEALEKSLENSRVAMMEGDEIRELILPVLERISEKYPEGDGLQKFCGEKDERKSILELYNHIVKLSAVIEKINKKNRENLASRSEEVRKSADHVSRGRRMAKTMKNMSSGISEPRFFDHRR